MNSRKTAKFISIVGLAVVVITVTAYIVNFRSHDISDEPSYWAYFGGYIGGVVSSVISLLALAGVAIGIHEQQKANSAVTAQSLLETLRSFEKDIDSSLERKKITITYQSLDETVETNAYELLMLARFGHAAKQAVTECKWAQQQMDSGKDISLVDDRIERTELFSRAASRLKMMAPLIEEHEKASGHNGMAIYYRSKYKLMFKTLTERGYDAGKIL